jgi:hypothetical protein
MYKDLILTFDYINVSGFASDSSIPGCSFQWSKQCSLLLICLSAAWFSHAWYVTCQEHLIIRFNLVTHLCLSHVSTWIFSTPHVMICLCSIAWDKRWFFFYIENIYRGIIIYFSDIDHIIYSWTKIRLLLIQSVIKRSPLGKVSMTISLGK